MAEKKRNIRYLDRDFNNFRNSLIEYSKTYFVNTYNDFTDTSTGMLFMEMASYVGDILSFYLDNQIQETYIQYSRQTENIFNHAYSKGYKPKVTTVSKVDLDFYQQLPATTSGSITIPDFSYCLNIPENTQITSVLDSDIKFIIEDAVDFSSSSSLDPTEISVYQLQSSLPTYYLLKKTRRAVSSKINLTSFAFTSATKFDKRTITDSNIVGILDVTDSDGNIWYEVPNMAQENVFDTVRNIATNDPNYSSDTEVQYLLKLKKVQRRFVSRFLSKTQLQLQFGAGTVGDNDEEIVPNPDNVGLGLSFEKDKLTTAYSPLNFVYTNTYGIAPSDTTLTIRYLTGGGVSSNVEAGVLTTIDDTNIKFLKTNLTDNTLANTIFNSVAVNNVKAADGGSDGDTIEEIRENALGNFQTQLRAVTPQDYLIRVISMPSNLGAIAKAYIEPTKIGDYQFGELPAILDLYILSNDLNKNLRTASTGLKQNLKIYLSEYRMANDSIRIKNAYIINIGVEFDIIVLPNNNNNEVLTKCISELKDYFSIDKWQINQPIILKDLYVLLSKVEGIQNVKDVTIVNKAGSSLGYSNYAYDVQGATLNNVVYPSIDPMIFEVKDEDVDIKGRVSPL